MNYYHSLTIEGILVKFPFKPYDSQISYMSAVIRCLNGRTNALLESPTGTGKTLCLLCACLAWSESMAPLEDGSSNKPLIIYSSRTHSQLAQISTEIKKTQYRPRIGLLGSREHLCSNTEVKALKDANAMAIVCRQKVKRNKCQQMLNLPSVLKQQQQQGAQILPPDIEDIKSFADKHRTCAFYMTKEMISSSNLLLLPYNYLLDRQIQKSIISSLSNGDDDVDDVGFKNNTNINNGSSLFKNGTNGANNTSDSRLRGAIVILDEAHNIEGVCEDLASIEIDCMSLHRCLQELNVIRSRYNNNNKTTNATHFSQQPEVEITEEDICFVEKFIQSLIEEINAIPLRKADSNGGGQPYKAEQDLQATFDGMYIYDLFSKVLGYPSTASFGGYNGNGDNNNGIAEVVQKTDSLVQYYFSKESTKSSELDRTSSTIKAIFCLDKEGKQAEAATLYDESHSYRTSVSLIADHYSSSNTSNHSSFRKISWWCFNAHIAIKQLMSNNLHSLILTSGTLAPFAPLEQGLRVRFGERLENNHVIDAGKQLRSYVLPKGPGNLVKLNSSFSNRNSVEYQDELGLAVERMVSVVPCGTLVFFPSYSVMDNALSRWRLKSLLVRDHFRGYVASGFGGGGIINNTNTNSNINNRNSVTGPRYFVEPKSKHLLPQMIEEYRKEVEDHKGRKAVFFAVCRGKLSEGLNFTDSLARAVIITGIPFPPFKDRRVQLKKEFMDGCCRTLGNGGGGEHWYMQQGFKAINQAIGRVIRSVDDYGSIIFLDERFSQERNRSMLSHWVRPEIRISDDISAVCTDLQSFYASFTDGNCIDGGGKITEFGGNITNTNTTTRRIGKLSAIDLEERKDNLEMVKRFFQNESQPNNNNIYDNNSNGNLCNTTPKERGENAREKESFSEMFTNTSSTTPKVSFVQEVKATLTIDALKRFKMYLRDWRKGSIPINVMIDNVVDVFWCDLCLSSDNVDNIPCAGDHCGGGDKDGKGTFLQLIRSFKSFIPSKNISYYEEVVGKHFMLDCKEDQKEKLECPICKEVVRNGFKSKCDHVACLECWTQWLGKRLECPLCRKRVRIPQLRKLPN